MREHELVFDEGFKAGLKPFPIPRNMQMFEVLRGAKVGKAGLEPIETLTAAYTHARPEDYPNLSADWPFPQYFYGMNRQMIGLRKTFYELLSDGTFVPVIIDIDDVQSNDLWSVGDFGLYQVVMKDGDFLVERAGDTGLWTKTLDPHATVPMAKTICNYKGQGVVGNFTFTNWPEADESYVGWSEIGNIDFTLARGGGAGYKKVEFRGPVYEVKPLGDGVVIYGRDGIAYLRAVTSPIATFGYTKLADFGIANKGAIGGNDLVHTFVSGQGDLYRVTIVGAFPQLKSLGYKDLLDSDSTIIVSFLPSSHSEGEGDFYIADGTYCYLLSSYGLSQANQIVSSAARVNKQAVGFFIAGASDFEAVTNIIDFEFRGRKTTEVIELGCSGSGVYEVALDYRYSPSSTFETTPYIALNNEGIASLRCSGTEFRLRIAYDSPEDIDISYARILYKPDDVRGIRGYHRNR